jgi:starch-binding outer membrane protein, SusD/RagB family
MRMNSINKLSLAGVMLLALTTSCKKENLSPIPQTNLSDAVAFGTPDRMAQQVNGLYSGMKNGNFLGGRGIVYNDVRGENWLNITGNGVTALGVWNYSVVSSDNQVENMWITGYAAINRANVVLAGIDANPSVVSTTQANYYRGEARFCRAVNYFYLTTLYGKKPFNADAGASLGIPLRLTAATSSGGEALARATQAQVFSQILADLTFAENNLPLRYVSGDSNVVRAHRNAAIAFKTRVYLHMGNYAAVILEANKIVNAAPPFAASSGVLHNLNANFTNVFRSPYTALESIFSLPMNNTNPPGTQNGLSQYHNAEFGLNAAGIVSDANWKATDNRKTLVTGTLRYQKYNDDLNNSVAIIRYSEVLLNLAEALARQNAAVDARAVALLNAVRQRSDPTTTFAPATQADLINLILNERNIELLGEGHRSIDLQRLGLAFPAKGTLPQILPTAQNYVWPIPATELLYNSLAVQN